MVSPLPKSPILMAVRVVLTGTMWLTAVSFVMSQPPAVHYWHAGPMPPGAIGRRQLDRGGPLHGYFQPVEIRAPHGVLISPASGGAFEVAQWAPLTVGMLIGEVYRFQVTGIPRNEGMEVFPSIEIIDRLYPPGGQKVRFPIPVELSLEDLEMALAGKMVTRVIYLENPRAALPRSEDPAWQRYYEALPTEDPLQIADQLGRPMAILRLGSRLPEVHGPDHDFLFGSPPLERYAHQPMGPRATPAPVQSAAQQTPLAALRDASLVSHPGLRRYYTFPK